MKYIFCLLLESKSPEKSALADVWKHEVSLARSERQTPDGKFPMLHPLKQMDLCSNTVRPDPVAFVGLWCPLCPGPVALRATLFSILSTHTTPTLAEEEKRQGGFQGLGCRHTGSLRAHVRRWIARGVTHASALQTFWILTRVRSWMAPCTTNSYK